MTDVCVGIIEHARTYEDSTLCEPEPNEPSLRSDEPSLVDPNPADTSSNFSFSNVTYEIMEQCSKQGRPKLINTQGYTYNQHRQRGMIESDDLIMSGYLVFIVLL